jgi:hypothetical protein
MALKHDGWNIFVSWSGRLGNQDITGLIGLALKVIFSSEILQICDDMLFVSGLPWNRGDLFEE